MKNSKTESAKQVLRDINGEAPVTKTELQEASRAQQKKALEEADLKDCLAKIEAALKDHNCELFCQPQITVDGRLTATAGVQNRKG